MKFHIMYQNIQGYVLGITIIVKKLPIIEKWRFGQFFGKLRCYQKVIKSDIARKGDIFSDKNFILFAREFNFL